jgi:two-component system, NarL family, sensor histidine kinase EvgS
MERLKLPVTHGTAQMSSQRLPLFLSYLRQALLTLVAWAGVGCVMAQQTAQQATPPAAPTAPIRVGLLAESPPFHTWPQGGQPAGYDVELLDELARLTGLNFVTTRYAHWDELQTALAAEQVDLVTATAMTPQRAQWMKFTRHYASVPQGFAGKHNITSVPAAPDLAGRRVAVARAFATETIAAERFPLAVRTAFGSEGDALAAASRGEVDFVFGSAPGLRALIAERGDTNLAVLRTFGFPEGQRRVGAKLHRADLIAQIDAAMAKIDDNLQARWHERWISRWEDSPIPQLATNDDVTPLKVGYFAGAAPFTFTDRSGQAAGVGIELLKATLQRAGLTLHSLQPVTLSGGLEELRKGRLDMMMGVTDTVDRQEYAHFVGPYRANPVVIVSRDHAQVTSLDQLAGRRLMVRKAFFGVPYVQSHHPTIEIVTCDNIDDCLSDVEAGKADAVLMGLDGATERLDVGKLSSLRVSGMVSHLQDEENLGLSRARAYLAPRLRDALQTAMRIDQPRIEREWVVQQANNRFEWADLRRWLLWAAAVLAALFALGFWHHRRLRREIVRTQRARTQSEQYLAFMAHEVRNSLQSVAGAMVLLRSSGARNEQQQPLLDALNRSSRSTLSLLNDLLDRHRLHAGAMTLTLRPESVERTITAVLDEVQPAAQAKGLQLHFEPLSPLPGWWQLDALRVQQVLRNLLVNAVKFSPRGTITVRAQMAPAGKGPRWRQLRVDVADQGPGLTPQQLRTLFTGMVTRGGDRPGSGLGLALSRELARAMGGNITVVSPVHADQAERGGAQFTLSLDVEQGEAPTAQAPGAAQRLLVVEDSPVYSLLLKEAFTRGGATTHMADSLAQARDALIASVAGVGSTTPAFDLVVADSNLGDGHVRELLAFMRESVRPGVQMPPTICISAEFSLSDQADLRQAGALDLLAKDSDVTAFAQRVLAAFAAARGATA